MLRLWFSTAMLAEAVVATVLVLPAGSGADEECGPYRTFVEHHKAVFVA